MSDFETCPVTGEKPEKIGCEQFASFFHLQYRCPLTDKTLAVAFTQPSFESWWRNDYIPAARKYAELLEASKPVEFQVGDVVGLSGFGYSELCYPNSVNVCREAEVIELLSEGYVKLSQAFVKGYGPCADVRWLRLISRPKKLTVADLPEIEGVEWDARRLENRNFCVYRNGDPFTELSYRTTHEAVAAALDFCNKIADAVNKKREKSK